MHRVAFPLAREPPVGFERAGARTQCIALGAGSLAFALTGFDALPRGVAAAERRSDPPRDVVDFRAQFLPGDRRTIAFGVEHVQAHALGVALCDAARQRFTRRSRLRR